MLISLFAFLSAASISGVAAYYSIIGLTAIFPAALIPVIIMGTVLEIGKIVSAVWLHIFWSRVSYLIRIYLSIAVGILMLITSLGIFGFLSKAHIDQVAGNTEYQIQIVQLDNQINRHQKIINDNQIVLDQLDKSVNTLIDAQRLRGNDGALAVRESQKTERLSLTKDIDLSNEEIAKVNETKSKILHDQNKLEAEVGPLKYIAEFIYGEVSDKSTLESAVKWLIILIVLVFDPLAVCLIIAAIHGMALSKKKPPTPEPLIVEVPVEVFVPIEPETIIRKKSPGRPKTSNKNKGRPPKKTQPKSETIQAPVVPDVIAPEPIRTPEKETIPTTNPDWLNT